MDQKRLGMFLQCAEPILATRGPASAHLQATSSGKCAAASCCGGEPAAHGPGAGCAGCGGSSSRGAAHPSWLSQGSNNQSSSSSQGAAAGGQVGDCLASRWGSHRQPAGQPCWTQCCPGHHVRCCGAAGAAGGPCSTAQQPSRCLQGAQSSRCARFAAAGPGVAGAGLAARGTAMWATTLTGGGAAHEPAAAAAA